MVSLTNFTNLLGTSNIAHKSAIIHSNPKRKFFCRRIYVLKHGLFLSSNPWSLKGLTSAFAPLLAAVQVIHECLYPARTVGRLARLSFMVLQRANHLRTIMATQAPVRSAQSPSYAVSLSVVPSHSPVVVRRAIKTPTDAEQVLLLKFGIFYVLGLKMACG